MKRGIVKRHPVHPGELLREEVLPELGLSVTAFAAGIKVSRQTAHKILAEQKGITPATALKIGKYIGNGAAVWLGMQQAFDLYRVEQEMVEELEEIHGCCT